MDDMFQNTSSFNQNISHWDTSACTSINNMFSGSSYTKFRGNFNFSKITSCNNLLSNAALTPIQMSIILVELYNNNTFVNKTINTIPSYLNTPYVATIVTALKTSPRSNSFSGTAITPKQIHIQILRIFNFRFKNIRLFDCRFVNWVYWICHFRFQECRFFETELY
jgi:hypothetical protein